MKILNNVVTHAEKEISLYLNYMLGWLENNGWAGWDPYDILDNHFGMWIAKRENLIQRTANALVSHAEDLFPMMLRQILRVKPQVNGKAMGLFAAGFLRLEAIENKPRLINNEAGYIPCFRWLEESKIDRFGGYGWGYPFDWRSRILIPRNTPTVVNTAIIGDAYWLKYKYHHDKTALLRCEDICQFFLSGLNRSGHKNNGEFCFSYTPVDTFQVHNANLFGAEFLIRIGVETGRDDWVKTGLTAANFSLSEIREDGTLNYWSNDQSIGLEQDTYHSGFEIRCFRGIASATGLEKIRAAADKYFRTWLNDYFSKNGTPCFVRSQSDIIEVHSCAESLLCALKMFKAKAYSKELFLKHIQKILPAYEKLWMQSHGGNGYFASKQYNTFGFEMKVAVPYIRWGQAWMFNALSETLATLKKEEDWWG